MTRWGELFHAGNVGVTVDLGFNADELRGRGGKWVKGGGKPDAAKSPFTIIKRRQGWAVKEEGQPVAVHSGSSKRDAQDFIDRVTKQRADLASADADQKARTAALLASRGIGPVDYRQLKPGDQFTWRPEVPPKTVTGVQHMASGASLVTWEKDAHTPRGENQTLMVPGSQAYGQMKAKRAAALPATAA